MKDPVHALCIHVLIRKLSCIEMGQTWQLFLYQLANMLACNLYSKNWNKKKCLTIVKTLKATGVRGLAFLPACIPSSTLLYCPSDFAKPWFTTDSKWICQSLLIFQGRLQMLDEGPTPLSNTFRSVALKGHRKTDPCPEESKQSQEGLKGYFVWRLAEWTVYGDICSLKKQGIGGYLDCLHILESNKQ